jgi:hypothetical protein
VQSDCSATQLEFQALGGRQVVAAFDGGRQTQDGGLLLLREVAERTGLIRCFASCFRDHRRPDRIEHTVEELLGQRVLAQAQGYEDLNDHDTLRDDPLLAVAAGKRDLVGARRVQPGDRGHALAGRDSRPLDDKSKFHGVIASPPIPIDQQGLVALFVSCLSG